MGLLVSAYWRPAYKHIRLKWKANAEDASDLVQGYFTSLLEKDTLQSYDAAAGRFHAWLRTCLDIFVIKDRIASQRQKRGGGMVFESLDFPAVEAEVLRDEGAEGDAEARFYKEWVRSFFALALQRLREECAEQSKQRHFEMWQRYDMAEETPISYEDLAEEYGIATTTVTNQLAALRRRFRKVLLETLRDVTADDREFRNETRSLLGVETGT